MTKTRKQVLAQMKKTKEFKERLAFTKDVFYPALIKSSKNIEDAQIFLGSLNTVLMEKFLGFMKEKKFGEFNLAESLDKTDPKFEDTKALLEIFKDMTVFEAKASIEGMKSEIALFVREEMESRTLDTLKTKWMQ